MKNVVDGIMRKPKKCPKCNSNDDIIPIKYGFPSSDMQYEWTAGKIASGGCIVKPGNPHWHCKNATIVGSENRRSYSHSVVRYLFKIHI